MRSHQSHYFTSVAVGVVDIISVCKRRLNATVQKLQVAAYAGLDIAAKVFFGWIVMLTMPIVSGQQDREYKE